MASDSELDLAALAAGRERDPTIEWLLTLAATGFAIPVTLVVDGYLITGAPVRDDHWGAALDSQVEGIISVTEEHYRRSGQGELPADQAKAFELIRANRLTDALRQRHEEQVRRRSEIEAQIPDGDEWDPRELPDGLGLMWAREQARERFMTLTGASIMMPPGRREDIGTVRVDIDRIGAWWPARFETAPEEGAAEEGATEGSGEKVGEG
jgi:hypothetical protein